MERGRHVDDVSEWTAPAPQPVAGKLCSLGAPAFTEAGCSDGPRLQLTQIYPAVSQAVPEARRAVAAFAARAGASATQLDAIRLAVSEAVSNVVRHGYRDVAGTLSVSTTVCDTELWVLVSDDGCGHRTAARDPGLGLGLALIADACDGFALVERSGGGTEAQMRFSLAPEPRPAA